MITAGGKKPHGPANLENDPQALALDLPGR